MPCSPHAREIPAVAGQLQLQCHRPSVQIPWSSTQAVVEDPTTTLVAPNSAGGGEQPDGRDGVNPAAADQRSDRRDREAARLIAMAALESAPILSLIRAESSVGCPSES